MSDAASSTQWRALVEAMGKLSAATSLDAAVEVIRSSARAIVQADGITFVRREGDMVRYVAEDAISPLWAGQRFPIEACISGIAILTKQPVVIADIYADSRVPHYAYRSTFVQSMAMFPVGLDAPIAAIGAYWSRTHMIDHDAITLMTMLARSASAVLELIDLNRTATEQESTLRRLAAAR